MYVYVFNLRQSACITFWYSSHQTRTISRLNARTEMWPGHRSLYWQAIKTKMDNHLLKEIFLQEQKKTVRVNDSTYYFLSKGFELQCSDTHTSKCQQPTDRDREWMANFIQVLLCADRPQFCASFFLLLSFRSLYWKSKGINLKLKHRGIWGKHIRALVWLRRLAIIIFLTLPQFFIMPYVIWTIHSYIQITLLSAVLPSTLT